MIRWPAGETHYPHSVAGRTDTDYNVDCAANKAAGDDGFLHGDQHRAYLLLFLTHFWSLFYWTFSRRV